MPLAVKTRLMCGPLSRLGLAQRGRGPRRLSASASASASASEQGSVHGPNTGPLPFVGLRGHRGPSRRNLPSCWRGLPGLPVPLVRRAAAARGPAGLGGTLPAGHGARRAARRARKLQDGGASRCQLGQAPTWRLDRVAESTRLVSTDAVRRENGADRGGPESRCGGGRGAPPTGGRL